jgi:hypothetical protein
VCIEENPRNYVDEFLELHWGINLKRAGALLWQVPISKKKSLNYLLNIRKCTIFEHMCSKFEERVK